MVDTVTIGIVFSRDGRRPSLSVPRPDAGGHPARRSDAGVGRRFPTREVLRGQASLALLTQAETGVQPKT